jgi:hypothetical protein
MPNSNTRSIQVGSEDNTLIATAYNTDGSIKADLAFDTTGISIFVQRIGEANGSALTLSAKATPATAHADGAFLNLGGGDISVDCPDAPFATYKGRARIYGTFTGGTIVGEWFDVVGFDASVVAVGANTTTPLDSNQTQSAAAAAITAAGLPTAALVSGEIASDVEQGLNGWEAASAALVAGLATSTNVTDARDSILNRIGAFAGTGANTILGFLRAVMRKDVAAPSDVGGDYDPATDSQEAIAEAVGDIEGGGGVAVNVLPAVGISADRSPGLTLKAFVGETITQSITLYETNGTTPIVLTGKTLVLVFETRQGVDVATVANSGITISGTSDNVVTFAYPSAATASERTLRFALRDAGSPNTVYLQGLLSVQRAPKVD